MKRNVFHEEIVRERVSDEDVESVVRINDRVVIREMKDHGDMNANDAVDLLSRMMRRDDTRFDAFS